jgi:hypothetical protein
MVADYEQRSAGLGVAEGDGDGSGGVGDGSGEAPDMSGLTAWLMRHDPG